MISSDWNNVTIFIEDLPSNVLPLNVYRLTDWVGRKEELRGGEEGGHGEE